MRLSAINADLRAIYPGAAVAAQPNRTQLDRVILAGASAAAVGMATDGAPPRGVVSWQSTGTLELSDWKLATGARYLTAGATYTLGTLGRLVAGGSGATVGVAVSRIELQLRLQEASAATDSGYATDAELAAHELRTDVHGIRKSYSDSLALGNGVDTGSVSGLTLDFTPRQVLLTVRKPVGGLNLFAVTVGDPTVAGFSFALNGATDAATYKLDYLLMS